VKSSHLLLDVAEHVIGAWAFADAFQVADLNLVQMRLGYDLNIMPM
jgi:hypothetical protein